MAQSCPRQDISKHPSLTRRNVHVSVHSAVLLFAKSGSLSQVLSSQSGAGPEPVQAQRGELRRPILSGAAVAGTMFRGHGSTWLMPRFDACR
jgi:hypothetical protein